MSYTYDALGERKTKTVNGVTTRYIGAPIFGFSRTLLEVDTSMNIMATYVHGGGEILKEEGSTTDRSQDLYYLTDGRLGNVRYTVDLSGKVQSTANYDVFGQRTVNQTGTVQSNRHYGYTGEMTEPESGLIYLRARYYDPVLGRFVSADPYRGRLEQPVSQNRYIYVHNNPLLYTDPSGLLRSGRNARNYQDGFTPCYCGIQDPFLRNGVAGVLGGATTGAIGGGAVGGVPGAVLGGTGGALIGGFVGVLSAAEDKTPNGVAAVGAISGGISGGGTFGSVVGGSTSALLNEALVNSDVSPTASGALSGAFGGFMGGVITGGRSAGPIGAVAGGAGGAVSGIAMEFLTPTGQCSN